MNPILRNILAVIAGALFGSVMNMALILISGSIIPPPEGADVTTMEGLKASLHLFQPKHFIFPFLAHAVGTLAGAILATFIASERNMLPAMIVGVLFLAGGIANVSMLPAPMWFNVVDIVFAYLPVAWIGHRLAAKKSA